MKPKERKLFEKTDNQVKCECHHIKALHNDFGQCTVNTMIDFNGNFDICRCNFFKQDKE